MKSCFKVSFFIDTNFTHSRSWYSKVQATVDPLTLAGTPLTRAGRIPLATITTSQIHKFLCEIYTYLPTHKFYRIMFGFVTFFLL